jgi:hypothetical protein
MVSIKPEQPSHCATWHADSKPVNSPLRVGIWGASSAWTHDHRKATRDSNDKPTTQYKINPDVA